MKKISSDDMNYGDLLRHTGYHIRRTYSFYSRIFAQYGKKFGIKSQQTTILILARNNPGITPASIADANEMERSLMAKLTADLEQRGFIERRPSESDKRNKGLFITKSGEKFLDEVKSTFLREVEPVLTRNLSESERKTLVRLLQKVYSS